jgi:radical SAM protein with 4Fe4S-binding SPASM domain
MTNDVAEALDNATVLVRFKERVAASRTPVDGSIELSHRCNLKCIHCYLGDQTEIRKHREDEMTTAQLKSLLNELAAAGTLNVTITGGDPMVRKDFAEVYEHAIRQGLLVTVFCDAVLITDRIVELFAKYPPRLVEVSLYGATAHTYESITQIRGSYDRCIAGVERLHANGTRFLLKTVLMTANEHELDDMRALADHYGVTFYFDSALFPCLPHDDNAGGANTSASKSSVEVAGPSLSEPLTLRVEPHSAAKAHVDTAARADELARKYLSAQGAPASDMLYQCGAALTTFHIDPYGNLQACTISTNTKHNVLDDGFEAGWYGPLKALRERRQAADSPCVGCDKRVLCVGCPAVFEAEMGSAEIRSSYMCATTHALFDAIEPRVRQLQSEVQ